MEEGCDRKPVGLINQLAYLALLDELCHEAVMFIVMEGETACLPHRRQLAKDDHHYEHLKVEVVRRKFKKR